MSQHSKRSVYISNAGGHCWTTRRSALRFVSRGEASWVNDAHSVIVLILDRADADLPSPANPRQAPRLNIVQLRIGQYRNEVLGLPNFCGFLKATTTHGRVV